MSHRNSRLSIVFLLMIQWFSGASQIHVCPLKGNWKFVKEYSDEFNSKKLDDSKWWDFNPAWPGRKPAHFSRKNVGVKKGSLQLTAKALDSTKVDIELRAKGMDKYSTAIVKSKNRIQYGYFEARCKSMKANVCNAFWLYDPLNADKKYREGSFSEEIDIFEIFGKPGQPEFDRVYWATLHRYETPYVESIVNKKKTKLEDYSKKIKMPYEFYDDYHTFGFLWTAEKLQWYVDGEMVWERKNDYFTNPLHIIFDAEIMEDWMGLPDNKDLPSTFYEDYIRAWQMDEG